MKLKLWPHGLRTPDEAFFAIISLLGQTNWAFGVFSVKLSALFCHCESLVHGKMDLVVFSTKIFGFQGNIFQYIPNSRKEFEK